MHTITFVDGNFITQAEASVSVRDLSLLRGYGVFDYLKTYKEKPLFLEDYLQRFIRSSQEMFLPLSYSLEELAAIVVEILALSQSHVDQGIRLLLTGGESADSMGIGRSKLVIMLEPLPIVALHDTRRLRSFSYVRESPEIKSINYSLPIRLQASGFLTGCTDVLYHSEAAGVTETSRCNVFAISDGVLFTPASGILRGVTRKHVIATAKQIGLQVCEQQMDVAWLRKADEIFLTSTTKGVLPIHELDGIAVKSTSMGLKLRHAFEDYIAK
jgi:branched-chain amino acid aminotransferase